ncbi:hypothetical protein [Actinophytocola sp.]|uniref:hypothetical protein n=1 Tax=Actinophytocola sp. TaxID=1872138 RepID=UPI003899D91C
MFAPKVVAARWLLLCALAFGVVGMHHFALMSHHGAESAMVSSTTVATQARDDEPNMKSVIMRMASTEDCCRDHAPTGTHNPLHLCLAVLAAGLALGTLLARRRRSDQDSGLPSGPAPVRRQRPPSGPPDSTAVLTSLGVLRL